MQKRIFTTILTIALSTVIANADLEIDVVSGAIPINNNTALQMCIEDEYIHFQAIGGSNNTDGEIPSWTVSDDTYAYGNTFYFVPPSITAATYTVRLYDGMVINDTVDNQGEILADSISVNVISCN